jgi:hypothetical protein
VSFLCSAQIYSNKHHFSCFEYDILADCVDVGSDVVTCSDLVFKMGTEVREKGSGRSNRSKSEPPMTSPWRTLWIILHCMYSFWNAFVPTLQMKVRAVFWVCILLYSSATNMEMSRPGWLQWPQWDAWCQETAEWGGCYALVCEATKTQSWKDATPILRRSCLHIQGGPPWHRLFILSWNSWRVFLARAGAYLVSTQPPQTSDWLCQQFSYVIK